MQDYLCTPYVPLPPLPGYRRWGGRALRCRPRAWYRWSPGLSLLHLLSLAGLVPVSLTGRIRRKTHVSGVGYDGIRGYGRIPVDTYPVRIGQFFVLFFKKIGNMPARCDGLIFT
jgi:hypothetical protein